MDNQTQSNKSFAPTIFYATLAALLIYLSFFFITQSKLFVKVLISAAFNHFNDSVEIVELSFKEHLFDFPDFYHFNNIDVVLRDANRKKWIIHLEELSARCENCFKSDKQMVVDLEDVDITYMDQINIENLNIDLDIDLKGWRFWKTKGGLTADMITYGAVKAKALQASINGFKDDFSLNQMWFKMLNGVIKGEIFLESKNKFPYSMNMQFVDVDLDQMGDAADAIKSNVKGVFDGFFEIAGNLDKVERINGRFILSKNGMLHSRLMKNLVQYLPSAAITDKLSQAMRNNVFIPIDAMEMTFSNNSSQSILTRNRILSREYNIDANLDVDIKEGTRLFNLKNLIQD